MTNKLAKVHGEKEIAEENSEDMLDLLLENKIKHSETDEFKQMKQQLEWAVSNGQKQFKILFIYTCGYQLYPIAFKEALTSAVLLLRFESRVAVFSSFPLLFFISFFLSFLLAFFFFLSLWRRKASRCLISQSNK